MATIPMIPIDPVTTLNRSILRTERKMSGTGADDFICGHCGYVILENFDPSTVTLSPAVARCLHVERLPASFLDTIIKAYSPYQEPPAMIGNAYVRFNAFIVSHSH